MSDNVPIIVCLLLYVVTALVSVLLVKFCIVLAERARILDVANERSLHTGVKPRTGGLAFLLLVTLAGIFICVNLYLEQTLPHWSLLGAGLLVGLISFYDDLKGLSTKLRFAMHFTAAGAVLFFHPVLLPMTLPGGLLIQNEYLVLGCLLLWMVGLTNAYNFMDGCDGIAGGQALMAGL
ncbi:MAG: hypothetical protein SFY80_17480, partial [Verrucomicrobiota bacterium]|nr:hypothetical protein [Verrucomicrobiota bacterium]